MSFLALAGFMVSFLALSVFAVSFGLVGFRGVSFLEIPYDISVFFFFRWLLAGFYFEDGVADGLLEAFDFAGFFFAEFVEAQFCGGFDGFAVHEDGVLGGLEVDAEFDGVTYFARVSLQFDGFGV
jgi:hypothetical protein